MRDIRWKKFLWLLCQKPFRYWLKGTLFYAIDHYEEKRGEGASDVAIFNANYGKKIIEESKGKD